MFIFFLVIVALLPGSGTRVMGAPGETPEFSNFSWFSMMFGAGLGVGLMVFATAEPLSLWGSNPVVVAGDAAGNTEESVKYAYRWTFAHYGFHAWAIYVVTGLSLAYYAYTRDMPLTIRSALTPLFGSLMNGFLGHVVDVLGVDENPAVLQQSERQQDDQGQGQCRFHQSRRATPVVSFHAIHIRSTPAARQTPRRIATP